MTDIRLPVHQGSPWTLAPIMASATINPTV